MSCTAVTGVGFLAGTALGLGIASKPGRAILKSVFTAGLTVGSVFTGLGREVSKIYAEASSEVGKGKAAAVATTTAAAITADPKPAAT